MADEDIVDSCQNCRFWHPGWKFKQQQRYASGAVELDAANPAGNRPLQEGFPERPVPALCAEGQPLDDGVDGNQ